MSRETYRYPQGIATATIFRMGELSSLIDALLEKSGQSDRAASLEATGKPDTIRNIRRGKSVSPRADTLNSLARVLGCSKERLMAAALRDLQGVLGVSLPPSAEIDELRVSGVVAAGIWLEIEQADESKDAPLPLIPDSRFPADRQFAVRVQGDSINKVAQDGEFLLCLGVDYHKDGSPIVEDGDLAVVQRTRPDGLREATVKRLRQGVDGWELHHESTEPRYTGLLRADEGLQLDEDGYEVRVIGRVLWTLGRQDRK